MDQKTVASIITFLKAELQQKGVKLRGIALFGSQLTGSSNPDSDIDLIIVSDNFQNKNIFERSDITMDTEIKALKKFHVPMDILKMTDEEFNQNLQNKRFYAQLI
ncbi:MAG: nucleotidyltransferase domain-containing protein [Bacteroidota bacterium]|nr:nucleotidyltransferase domain-containing protein [Bacteroidota bacterium]